MAPPGVGITLGLISIYKHNLSYFTEQYERKTPEEIKQDLESRTKWQRFTSHIGFSVENARRDAALYVLREKVEEENQLEKECKDKTCF